MVAELLFGSGVAALSGCWQGFINQRGVAWMARRGCRGGQSGRRQQLVTASPQGSAYVVVLENMCKWTIC